MKSALGAIGLMFLLGACTGTREVGNPILLVTGYRQADGSSHVALIKDSFGETGASENRLQFLPGSVRSLPAPAVSYDVVDRGGTRSTLVVLSRGPVTAGNSTSYLTLFSLRGIDPDNPANFRETRELTIGPDVDTLPDTLVNPQFCPSSVQVTQTGAYAAVLNEPGLCRFGGQPSIDIFNLQGPEISLVQRIDRVAAGGITLSQGAAQDLLYYAVNAPGTLLLQEATLPRPGDSFGPDDEVAVRRVATVGARAPQGDFVDLGRADTFAEERLVVLFDESLVSVTGFGGEGTASEPIETPPNNARLIRDDLRDTEATLILSTPEARRFTYVPPPLEDVEANPQSADVIATDAVVEPTYGFVYFVAGGPGQAGRVSIFDLNSYDLGDTLPDPTPFPVAALDNAVPSFATWAQAVSALPIPTTP